MDGNKPLFELTPDFIHQNIKALTFDLDGVIVPKGTIVEESPDGTDLHIKTKKLSSEMVDMIKRLKKYFWINFSSGKGLLYLQHMLDDILWEKVSLCAENGNFILMDGKVHQLVDYDLSYFQKITDIRGEIKLLKQQQPDIFFGFEPKHIIMTVYAANPVPEIEQIVKKHDPQGELYCLWTNEGYDVGHKNTSKRTGLQFLIDRLGIGPKQMITSGNNLNDREMLEFGVGVTVDPERVGGDFAIPKVEGQLGGEVLAKYLLEVMER
ncbi:MAG: HAD hydrolase family protein [Candidatus Shapirobacteria bacterium]